MRTAIIAVTLIAASSVSSAPIPLPQDGSQPDFALEERDWWGSGLKNIFSKKGSVSTDTISNPPVTQEDPRLLTTLGRHDDLDTPAEAGGHRSRLDGITSAPVAPPVQKTRFRDSQWAQDHLWKWEKVNHRDAISSELFDSSKHKKVVNSVDYISDGGISKKKAAKEAAIAAPLVVTATLGVGALGYGGYHVLLKPLFKPKHVDNASCMKNPEQRECQNGDLIH